MTLNNIQYNTDYTVPNIFPSSPHKEASNKHLTVLYIMNIIFVILTAVLAAGEIASIEKCKSTCPDGVGTIGETFFWISIIVLILCGVILILSVYSLVKKSGFSEEKRTTINLDNNYDNTYDHDHHSFNHEYLTIPRVND